MSSPIGFPASPHAAGALPGGVGAPRAGTPPSFPFAPPAIAHSGAVPGAASNGPTITLTPTHTVQVVRSLNLSRGQHHAIPVELKAEADKVQSVYTRIVSTLAAKTGLDIDDKSLRVSLKYGRITYRDTHGGLHTHVMDMTSDADEFNILRKEALTHLQKVDPNIKVTGSHAFKYGGYDEHSEVASFVRDHPVLVGLPKDLSNAAKRYLSVALASRPGEAVQDLIKRRREAMQRIAYAQRSKFKAQNFLRNLVIEQRAQVNAARKDNNPDLAELDKSLQRYEQMLGKVEKLDEFALLSGLAYFDGKTDPTEAFKAIDSSLQQAMIQDVGIQKFASSAHLRSQNAQTKDAIERQRATLEYLADIKALAFATGNVLRDQEGMFSLAQQGFKNGTPKGPTVEGIFFQAALLGAEIHPPSAGAPGTVDPRQADLGMAFAMQHLNNEGMARAFAREIGLTPEEKAEIDAQLSPPALQDNDLLGDVFSQGRVSNPKALKALLGACARTTLSKPNLDPVDMDLFLQGTSAGGTGLIPPPSRLPSRTPSPSPIQPGPRMAMPPTGSSRGSSRPVASRLSRRVPPLAAPPYSRRRGGAGLPPTGSGLPVIRQDRGSSAGGALPPPTDTESDSDSDSE